MLYSMTMIKKTFAQIETNQKKVMKRKRVFQQNLKILYRYRTEYYFYLFVMFENTLRNTHKKVSSDS